MKHIARYLIAAILVVSTVAAMPVLADVISPPVNWSLNVTYPVSLTTALGTSANVSDAYSSLAHQVQGVQNLPAYLWFKSTNSYNGTLANLYLSFVVPGEALRISYNSTELVYNATAGAYMYGPITLAANETVELVFKVVPLQRGYYTLSTQWTQE